MRVAGSLVVALTLFGCGLGMSEDEQRLCAAGQQLAGAITLLRQAVAEDEAGNTIGARALAIRARSTSEAVRVQMTTMELEVHQARAWDGLADADAGLPFACSIGPQAPITSPAADAGST